MAVAFEQRAAAINRIPPLGFFVEVPLANRTVAQMVARQGKSRQSRLPADKGLD